MGGFYLINSPSQHIYEHETEYAINKADMRAIAQCAAAVHNSQIRGTVFEDVCVQQNNIISQYICLDNRMKVTSCEIVRNKKPAFSYIITATGVLDYNKYNDIMEVLEQDFSDAGTFGIFDENVIMSGGTGNPYFTTDSGAALRSLEIGADALLKGTRVDGVYTADPEKDPNAVKYDELTFDKAIEDRLKVMDQTAFALCREGNMPIIVFDMNEKGNLTRLVKGEKVGTLVHV